MHARNKNQCEIIALRMIVMRILPICKVSEVIIVTNQKLRTYRNHLI